MRTIWISGAAPLPIDLQLNDQLRTLTLPPPADGFRFRAAIEGRDGRVYRILETGSLVEAVRLHEILRDLGLRKEPDRRKAPLTAVFRLRQATAMAA